VTIALYLDRKALAAALMLGESTVDDLVRRRVIPGPLSYRKRKQLWNWARVDRALQARDLQLRTIYVLGFGPYRKIGITSVGGLPLRLAGLQVGCPEKLEVFAQLEGNIRYERELHARFADQRVNGEWFRHEGELAAWIEAGCPL
jgi:hypothetical protein